MTAGKTPFFSILVPTRDRPEFIRYSLESLKRQTFADFEVVVCDNATTRPCREVFDGIADARFHYVAPPSQLSMADNWEFATRHARGQYVGVLIDKTVLMPSALEATFELVSRARTEIVSWWNDNYYQENAATGHGAGTYMPAHEPCEPGPFDPAAELQRRFRLDVRRGDEGKHYYWGKICFGVYRSDLVERIRARIGRLFMPMIPDYTSMLAALGLADSAVDLGRPLLVSFSSELSTGASVARDPRIARNFYMQIDPGAIEQFPLPGLYASHHNGVANEYLRIQRLIGGRMDRLQLNRDNLILRAMEDLERQQWNSESERLEQEGILAAHLKTLRMGALAGYRLSREFSRIRRSAAIFSTARRLLRPLARRFPGLKALSRKPAPEQHQPAWQHGGHFSSIIEAADAANGYYQRRLAEKARVPA